MKVLNHEELISFCSQLSMILHAGISSIEGLAIMKEDLPEGDGKKLLEALYGHMEESGNLAEAMEETKVFPEYVCSMTQIGEQTGRLDEVMKALSVHYEREKNLSETIKSALFYPAVMLGMLAVVILILILRVMPVFQRVLEQLGGGLTGASAGILHIGNLISRYSMVFVLLLALLAAAVFWLGLTQKGQKAFRRWLEQSKLTGKTAEKIACARVAEGLSLCMFSGLDMDQSMEMTEKLVKHEDMKRRIARCREMMEEGEDFDQALTKSNIFSGLYGKMVSVGIRTGSADQVMEKIAGEYEEEVAASLQNKVAVIEPTLVAVLSVVAGLILISVMLPLMNIMSNLG